MQAGREFAASFAKYIELTIVLFGQLQKQNKQTQEDYKKASQEDQEKHKEQEDKFNATIEVLVVLYFDTKNEGYECMISLRGDRMSKQRSMHKKKTRKNR